MWLWLSSWAGKSKEHELISSILLKSRKRNLTIAFTTQSFHQVNLRIRDVTDFIAYPLMSVDNSYTRLEIFRGPRASMGTRINPPIYFTNEKVYAMFNSILEGEKVIFFNDEILHIDSIEKVDPNNKIFVPCFDNNFKMTIKPISAFIKHQYNRDAFEIETVYGRKVKVTGDHSVFSWVSNWKKASNHSDFLKSGKIKPVPVRNLKVGDWIAIPSKLPVIEKDIKKIKVWELVKDDFEKYKQKYDYKLKIENGKIFWRYKRLSIPNEIEITNDLLWLLGFYVAEGFNYKDYRIGFTSEEKLLKKANKIINSIFGLNFKWKEADETRSPSLFRDNRLICVLFRKLLENKNWILQLPLNRLKYFLYGWWQGDGYHKGNFKNCTIATSSEELADFLLLLFARFGLVAGKLSYITKFKNKKFKAFRVTVSGIKNLDILSWDRGIKQKTIYKKIGDLILVKIKRITPCKSTKYVYDFAVPETENFLAGNLICCHNTYEEVKPISKEDSELQEQFFPIEENYAFIRYLQEQKRIKNLEKIKEICRKMQKEVNPEGITSYANL